MILNYGFNDKLKIGTYTYCRRKGKTNMREELEERLGKNYPFMRKQSFLAEQRKNGYISDLYGAFGCECYDGWYGVIDEMCSKITDVYAEEEIEPDIVIDQIKEKYGTLRFYYHFEGRDKGIAAIDILGKGSLRMKAKEHRPIDKKIFDIVDWGEKQSGHICELCSSPGVLRNDDWLMVRCDDCWKKYLKKNKNIEGNI